MIVSNSFDPSDLNNVHSFREKFFTGEKELAVLDALPPSAYKRPKNALYYSSFEVVWVLSTLPFRLIHSVFLRSISAFLHCFGFEKTALSIDFTIRSKEAYIDSIVNQLLFGSRLIVPSSNIHDPDSRYLADFKPIPRERLKSSFIRKYLIDQFDKVTLYKWSGGLCSGSANWFNYLFLLGLDRKILPTSDLREYMTAISLLFKDGQPIQAALLQALYGIDCPLLGIKEQVIRFWKVDKEFVQNIKSIPIGLYHVRIKGVHSISLYKDQEEFFVFDSNRGLLHFKGADETAHYIEKEYASSNTMQPIFFEYQTLDRPSLFARTKRVCANLLFG